MFEALIGMLMAFLFVFALMFLVFYILQGMGLMGIAKNMGLKNGWMAWVPLLNLALIGKIAFNNIIVQIALPVLLILSGSYESTVNGETVMKGTILPSPFNDLATFAFVILLFVCLYKIYKKLSTKEVAMIIFSILSFGLLSPIFLFAIRKNPVLDDNTQNTPQTNNNSLMNNIPPVNNNPSINNISQTNNQTIPSPKIPTDSPPAQNDQL